MTAPHLPWSTRVRPENVRRSSELRPTPFETCRLIEAEMRARLLRSPYGELRRVTGDFHEGILTLRGRVSSFYLKQIAQSLVQRLEGVERIVNRVEVTGPNSMW